MKSRLLISLVIIAGALIAIKTFSTSEATPSEPAYAKWGRVAMEKVKEKYPYAQIVDYLHVEREVGDSTTKETFKLWLRKLDKHEFGVYVTITFDNKTEKIVDIHYKETNQ